MNKAPAIIPPERVIESTSRTGVEGWFDVELIHKPTGLVKQKLRFRNVITNAGLDWIGNIPGNYQGVVISFGSNAGWLGVGTGTTEPSVTDIALAAQVTRTNSQGNPAIGDSQGVGPDNDYFWYKTTKVLLPGVGTGNLTEVGLFNGSGTATMWCRQLFRDSLGTPITIVKTVDDELRVTYEFRIYPMKVSNVSTFTIKGIERTCTTRAYDIDSTNSRWGNGGNSVLTFLGFAWGGGTAGYEQSAWSSSMMPALTATQTGTAVGSTSFSWAAYVGSSYYRDQSFLFNPGLGNVTVGSMTWGSNTAYNAPFITTISPAFQKTETERFTFTGRFSWGRV